MSNTNESRNRTKLDSNVQVTSSDMDLDEFRQRIKRGEKPVDVPTMEQHMKDLRARFMTHKAVALEYGRIHINMYLDPSNAKSHAKFLDWMTLVDYDVYYMWYSEDDHQYYIKPFEIKYATRTVSITFVPKGATKDDIEMSTYAKFDT